MVLGQGCLKGGGSLLSPPLALPLLGLHSFKNASLDSSEATAELRNRTTTMHRKRVKSSCLAWKKAHVYLETPYV